MLHQLTMRMMIVMQTALVRWWKTTSVQPSHQIYDRITLERYCRQLESIYPSIRNLVASLLPLKLVSSAGQVTVYSIRCLNIGSISGKIVWHWLITMYKCDDNRQQCIIWKDKNWYSRKVKYVYGAFPTLI